MKISVPKFVIHEGPSIQTSLLQPWANDPVFNCIFIVKLFFRRKTLQMQRAESRARPSSKQRTTSSSSSIFNESLEEAMFENKSIGRMDVLMESTAVHYRPMHGSSGRQRTDTIREKIALTMSKLISWSEQIAHGMDYLSSKRVIHGDLACRYTILFYFLYPKSKVF